ncbi:MAG: hypothetical protein WED00_16410 [Aquisalimonadaceae bacterium]
MFVKRSFISITLSLFLALLATCAAFADNRHFLDCEDGRFTSLDEVKNNGESSTAFYSGASDREFWGTIMIMVTDYDLEGPPLTRVDPSLDNAARINAILDNYQSVVLEDMHLWNATNRSEFALNGRRYVGFEGKAVGRDRKTVAHVTAYEHFAKIALITDLDGEDYDFLLVMLDDAIRHCHLPSMTK